MSQQVQVIDAGTVHRRAMVSHRLGGHLESGGLDVVVHAPHATDVWLCLFDSAGEATTERRFALMPAHHGHWSGHVPDIAAGQAYGFRAAGPWDPGHGHRHNEHKLLTDPYARGLAGSLELVPQVYGAVVDGDLRPVSDAADARDSAPFVPWSVALDEPEAVSHHPRLPWSKTVIYEAHIKGLTMGLDGVPQELRGTYAGLAHPATIRHLTDLGVTAVELLPIFAKVSEPALTRRGAVNYWGYNTLGFFAPEPSYATAAAQEAGPGAVLAEVIAMVAALHEAGLEVLLDVVYNHTAEGGADGPQLCWRGLDNSGFYLHSTASHAAYLDVTGTGNSVDFRAQSAVSLALDSMRYWVQKIGVDGFRLDLAVTLGRNGLEFDPRHPVLRAMATDPVLASVKQIAEPWDIGPDGWRTGQFAAPMAEWNDRFRDVVRSFWLTDIAAMRRGEQGQDLRDLATRLAGSADFFGHTDIPGGRGPTSSINYVTAHDGFTLADLVSYDVKHNWANGESNADGTDNNLSANHGVEGPTDDAAILAARRRSIRNIAATLLMSAGTPMITAGDELGRTQRGNNNGYALDDDTVWVDWDLQPWQDDLLATMRHLLILRRENPALRPQRYTTFSAGTERWADSVSWFDAAGAPMRLEAWENRGARVLQMLRRPLLGEDRLALVIINGTLVDAGVALAGEGNWALAWDSVWDSPQDGGARSGQVTVAATSVQVYLQQR